MSDPTMEIVRRIKDRSAWAEVVEGVPVFVPHERDDPEGNPVTVDKARLETIARNINLRFERKGVPLIFTEGHRFKDKKTGQWKRRPVLSYGANARVGRWGPGRELGILVDQFIPTETLDRVRDHPFRSAEFYPDADAITSVALLRTDPALDMGVVEYEGQRGCLLYHLEYAMPLNYEDEEDEEREEREPPKREPDPTKNPREEEEEEGELDEGKKKEFMQYMASCYPKLHASEHGMSPANGPMEEHERQPRRPAREGKGAKGANGATPAPGRRGEDADALHYERRMAEVEKRQADLERRERLLVYERELAALHGKGYEFRMKDELAEVADMDRERFDRHRRRIVSNYRRREDPTLYERVPVDDSPEPEEGGGAYNPHRETDLHRRTMEYVRAHPGVTYEAAQRHVKEQTPPARRRGRREEE